MDLQNQNAYDNIIRLVTRYGTLPVDLAVDITAYPLL